jgi:methylthioxylose transferase
MRRSAFLVVAAGAALVAALAVGLGSGRLPLGVPGEWEWPRVRLRPSPLPLSIAFGSIATYSAFVAIGLRSLKAKTTRRREAGWLAGLVVAAVGVQGFVQEGAPEGYGLSKWIFALHAPGSSGYFTVAKAQMADPARFLANYPDWIAKQDALHIGTHPPGLFLASRAILEAMAASPGLAKVVVDRSPPSVAMAVQVLRETKDLNRADGSALALTGALTLLACSLTVVPLYLLARSSLPSTASWVSAAFWPIVPSAMMFQPTADTAFPLLSTMALAMAARARRSDGVREIALAIGSGVVMAVGMEFTLAFLPVGLVVALILLAPPVPTWVRPLGLIGATGVGFLGATLAWWVATSANPFVVWWWNQRNHARFYADFPRTYHLWVLVNPIELAVGLGLPSASWVMAGLISAPREIRVTWATLFVLAILTIGGRNLSEVARLWLPLMPTLLVAAGAGFDRLGAGPRLLATSTVLVGVQALILQSTIQVVYPF